MIADTSTTASSHAEEPEQLVREEMNRLAETILARRRQGRSLHPTSYVHEAYPRVVHAASWHGTRALFLRLAAHEIRAALVHRARVEARRGDATPVVLDDVVSLFEEPDVDLFAMDEVLHELAQESTFLAELVELRFFAGLTLTETAEVLGVSMPVAYRSWREARRRLRQLLRSSQS